jgi:hypothetical protein
MTPSLLLVFYLKLLTAVTSSCHRPKELLRIFPLFLDKQVVPKARCKHAQDSESVHQWKHFIGSWWTHCSKKRACVCSSVRDIQTKMTVTLESWTNIEVESVIVFLHAKGNTATESYYCGVRGAHGTTKFHDTAGQRQQFFQQHWVAVLSVPHTAQTQHLQTLNPLRPSGNYMNHLLWQSVMLHFVFIGFAWFSL